MVGSGGTTGAGSAVLDPHDSEWHENDDDWTTEIPMALLDYEDVFDHVDSDNGEIRPPPEVQPGPGEKGYSTEPPKLPAQLTQGILNMGSKGLESVTDDNSLLPKPDHSVLNHLAASPIKHGLLSVGVTTRYKRKVRPAPYFTLSFARSDVELHTVPDDGILQAAGYIKRICNTRCLVLRRQ